MPEFLIVSRVNQRSLALGTEVNAFLAEFARHSGEKLLQLCNLLRLRCGDVELAVLTIGIAAVLTPVAEYVPSLRGVPAELLHQEPVQPVLNRRSLKRWLLELERRQKECNRWPKFSLPVFHDILTAPSSDRRCRNVIE